MSSSQNNQVKTSQNNQVKTSQNNQVKTSQNNQVKTSHQIHFTLGATSNIELIESTFTGFPFLMEPIITVTVIFLLIL